MTTVANPNSSPPSAPTAVLLNRCEVIFIRPLACEGCRALPNLHQACVPGKPGYPGRRRPVPQMRAGCRKTERAGAICSGSDLTDLEVDLDPHLHGAGNVRLSARVVDVGGTQARRTERAAGWVRVRAIRNVSIGEVERLKPELSVDCFRELELLARGEVSDWRVGVADVTRLE